MKSRVALVLTSLKQEIYVDIDDLIIEPLTVLQGLAISSGGLQFESATQDFILGSWTQSLLNFLLHLVCNFYFSVLFLVCKKLLLCYKYWQLVGE